MPHLLAVELGSIPRLLIEFLAIFFATILIIFLLKNGSAHGELLVTFALFAAIAFKLLPSLNRIITNIQSLRNVGPTLDVLENEFKLEGKKEVLPNDKNLFKLNKDISFNKVSFCYPGANQDIINNVSFSINKGDITGIIGESGSGKSTVLNLILGLFAIGLTYLGLMMLWLTQDLFLPLSEIFQQESFWNVYQDRIWILSCLILSTFTSLGPWIWLQKIPLHNALVDS